MEKLKTGYIKTEEGDEIVIAKNPKEGKLLCDYFSEFLYHHALHDKEHEIRKMEKQN